MGIMNKADGDFLIYSLTNNERINIFSHYNAYMPFLSKVFSIAEISVAIYETTRIQYKPTELRFLL